MVQEQEEEEEEVVQAALLQPVQTPAQVTVTAVASCRLTLILPRTQRRQKLRVSMNQCGWLSWRSHQPSAICSQPAQSWARLELQQEPSRG